VADRFRIAIVDPYPIFLEGVVQSLRRDKRLAVVGQGATAKDAERLVHERRPDILLLEVAVPGSLVTARSILQTGHKVKVIFLASIEEPEHATDALAAGVHGYIMKGITGPQLIEAIKAVHGGERYITPDLAWLLVAKPALPATTRETKRRPNLSVREQQVLDCASKGLTNQEIAHTMGIALGTVKYYKKLALSKMGVRNLLEAMVATDGTVKKFGPA
jgi:two-component system, NarL family, nitrate/nitrite response regulator NarL